MAPKIALVTGTNSGIGLAASVQLCQAGYTTYATVRSLAKATALREAAKAAGVVDRLKVIEMDVSNDASVASAVTNVLAETDNTLDVVVANAGYGDLSPPEAAAVQAFQDNLNVNLFGVVRLANAVLPSMRAAGRGRIIATSSILGLVAMPMMPVYATTKFALEGYMESMAAAYAGIGIHFSLVEPGPVATAFSDNATVPNGMPAELRPAAKAMEAFMGRLLSQPQSSEECAKYIVRAATEERPQLRYMTYEPVEPMIREKYVDLTGGKTLAALTAMVAPLDASS